MIADESEAEADQRWMGLALRLAMRGLGNVWPNPAVGCVLVRDGTVVGRGWTQSGGRPHAETEALFQAGERARGATAYVTLEPCDHWGQTGPCSLALLAAGIARAVVAVTDPDSRVCGQGIARLQDAGVDTETGVLESQARQLNRGFFRRVQDGRPLLTLKLASSLDGRIATCTGDSHWISCDDSRRTAHALRSTHDAVMVGAETAIIDNPMLTVRLPGAPVRQPVRVVADARLRLPLDSALLHTAREVPVWVVTAATSDGERRRKLQQAGVDVLEVALGPDGRLSPPALAAALAGQGLTRVLIEGGGTLAAAFLKARLVDQLAWFHAPKVIGGEGRPAVAPLPVQRMGDAAVFHLRECRTIGEDIFALYDAKE